MLTVCELLGVNCKVGVVGEGKPATPATISRLQRTAPSLDFICCSTFP